MQSRTIDLADDVRVAESRTGRVALPLPLKRVPRPLFLMRLVLCVCIRWLGAMLPALALPTCHGLVTTTISSRPAGTNETNALRLDYRRRRPRFFSLSLFLCCEFLVSFTAAVAAVAAVCPSTRRLVQCCQSFCQRIVVSTYRKKKAFTGRFFLFRL